MFLNQTAVYALRAMTQLALSPNNEPVRASDLSEQTGIPTHYLSKIMRRMVTSKLVESQRGHGGGFVITRDLHSIRFVDILRAVDVQSEPNQCVFGWGTCDAAKPCPLHFVWSQAMDTINEWSGSTSLGDVRRDTGMADKAR